MLLHARTETYDILAHPIRAGPGKSADAFHLDRDRDIRRSAGGLDPYREAVLLLCHKRRPGHVKTFSDDPAKSNEAKLEAIQMAWLDEWKDSQK